MTFTNDLEELKKIVGGWTVAHGQVSKGWTTEDKEILQITDKLGGWTVAHFQAENGWVTEDKEILQLSDIFGWSVAHRQAKMGWVTEDNEILQLKNAYGYSIVDCALAFRINNTPLDEINFEEAIKIKGLLNEDIQEVIESLAK